MEVRIMNSDWIDIEDMEDKFMIIANGTNGNTVVIEEISKKYLKQFIKDLNKLKL